MSTLNVSNITDGTTTVGTEYVVNGSAKAWVNFNGTGTVAIQDSLNVSSLTDYNTGHYRLTFASSMGSSYYSATALSNHYGGVTTNTTVSTTDWLATSLDLLLMYDNNAGGASFDANPVSGSVTGDLA
jgi:hypothetical protein